MILCCFESRKAHFNVMINGTWNKMLQPGEFVVMIPTTHEFLLCGTPKSAFCLFCQSFILVLYISMCYPETAIWSRYSFACGWKKIKTCKLVLLKVWNFIANQISGFHLVKLFEWSTDVWSITRNLIEFNLIHFRLTNALMVVTTR